MSNPDLNQLRDYIAQGRLDRVFEKLKESQGIQQDTLNQILTLSAKFSDTHRKENMGMISQDEAMRLNSQVNFGLLEIIDDLGSEAKASPVVNEIIAAPKAADSPGLNVFISYNHNDTATANMLKDRLRAEHINVTIDSEKMVAGSDIKEFIENCVSETQTTISLISKKSLLSAWVAMESINTFYHEKTKDGKKFIACYIEDDFFRRDFTDNALDSIEAEIKEIQELITARMQKNRSIRDLQNELDRMTNLRNNMDEIVRRLRESLCIDIRNENLDLNFNKIVQAIKS